METFVRSFDGVNETDQEISGRIFEFDRVFKNIEGRDEVIPSTCKIDISPTCLALRGHDKHQILGKKDVNLSFERKSDGLYFRLKNLGTRLWDDTREMVKNKLLSGVSGGFRATPIYENNVRKFDSLILDEVSVVNQPAYESAYVNAREKTEDKIHYPPSHYL